MNEDAINFYNKFINKDVKIWGGYVGNETDLMMRDAKMNQTIIETTTFNALLWIIILFTSVNTITKSFVQESENRLLYMYSLANPQEIIVGKLIYNSILLLLISLVTFSAYALFLGNPIVNLPGFLGALVLGSLGLSILLTLMAAIASKSSNNPALMAILSFPIIIPFSTPLSHLIPAEF